MANVNMQYILWGQKREYERWLADVKSGFRALESVGQLERQVADLRREIRGAVQGVDKTLYRYYKYELQQRWLNYYEDKLVNKLEEAIGKAAPGCLTVIVMPEAVIRDYVMEDETKENSFRGRNYVNPLYEETVRKFLGPSISGGEVGDRFISEEDGNQTLLQFTANHEQALLFAGTVWWKQWSGNYPDGIVFNSAPVFYRGRCCFMWDKQFLSDVDGLVEDNMREQWFKYRINEMPVAEPLADPVQYPNNIDGMDKALYRFFGAGGWSKRGILSSLTADYNLAGTPLLEIEYRTGEGLLFGVDICKDNIVLQLDNRNDRLIPDLDAFLKQFGLKFHTISMAEYFATAGAAVNFIRSDGECMVLTGKERKVDISVILANNLKDIINQARYHACKADAYDYGNAVSLLITKEREKLNPLTDNFFLMSRVVGTEPEGE